MNKKFRIKNKLIKIFLVVFLFIIHYSSFIIHVEAQFPENYASPQPLRGGVLGKIGSVLSGESITPKIQVQVPSSLGPATAQQLSEYTHQIIDYTASWCVPCQEIKPQLDVFLNACRKNPSCLVRIVDFSTGKPMENNQLYQKRPGDPSLPSGLPSIFIDGKMSDPRSTDVQTKLRQIANEKSSSRPLSVPINSSNSLPDQPPNLPKLTGIVGPVSCQFHEGGKYGNVYYCYKDGKFLNFSIGSQYGNFDYVTSELKKNPRALFFIDLDKKEVKVYELPKPPPVVVPPAPSVITTKPIIVCDSPGNCFNLYITTQIEKNLPIEEWSHNYRISINNSVKPSLITVEGDICTIGETKKCYLFNKTFEPNDLWEKTNEIIYDIIGPPVLPIKINIQSKQSTKPSRKDLLEAERESRELDAQIDAEIKKRLQK